MPQEEIYVVGHTNPDSDSICSAIAYARLRKLQGLSNVRPARAGNINRQTQFILDELAVPQPELILDVSPRIGDVISRQVPVSIDFRDPLSRAMELFHLHNIRILPVLDEDKKPLGLLYLKKLAERFLVPSQVKDLRCINASPRSICQCLKARFVTEFDADSLEDLNLFVAAMAEESFKEKIQDHDMRKVVLIVGDRYEVLRHVVERGVRVLIVVGDLPIPEDICEVARQHEVTILSTAFDTSTSAWLTRLATPVGNLVQTDYVTLHEEDRLEQLKMSLMHSPVPGVLVLNDHEELLAVATKSNLFAPSRRKLILVDHNELSQAVAGADKVEIIEIVDHHRLGNLQTDKPIQFINKPLGSTCTLVATLYQEAGIDPEPAIAGLMLAGLLSDTIVLKSPTTTDVDRQIAFWLGQHSGLDPYEFGQRIFSSSSAISAYDTLTDVITSDFKVFQAGSYEFGIGQVEVVSFHEFMDQREALATELEQVRKHRDLAITGLLVTDIVAGDSMLLVAAEEGMAFSMGYPQREANLYELKGVLSRKKQLIPHLLRVLSS